MRLHAIDGLRAVAMTMVVAQHCGLLPFGWTGVWLFFVISGYVITQGFLAGSYSEATARGSYMKFMGRRATRIIPVYLLYLLTCVVVVLLVGKSEKLVDLGHLATFTYNWQMMFQWWPGFGGFGPFGHLWTLSVEQQFYVFFGLFAVLLPARMQLAAGLVVIAAGPLVRWGWSLLIERGFMYDPGRHAFAVYAATPCHVDAFLMGSVVARLEPKLRKSPLAVTMGSLAAIAAAVTYAAVYVSINRALGIGGLAAFRNVFSGVLYGHYREVFVYVAVDLVAVTVLLHVLLDRPGTRLLSMPAVAWVGRISYGCYLFHALVIWNVGHFVLGGAPHELPLAQRVIVFVMLWSLTVEIASASFVWFEKPLTKRWPPKRGRESLANSGPRATISVAEPRSAMQDIAPTA